jgi:hypothetical protein
LERTGRAQAVAGGELTLSIAVAEHTTFFDVLRMRAEPFPQPLPEIAASMKNPTMAPVAIVAVAPGARGETPSPVLGLFTDAPGPLKTCTPIDALAVSVEVQEKTVSKFPPLTAPGTEYT